MGAGAWGATTAMNRARDTLARRLGAAALLIAIGCSDPDVTVLPAGVAVVLTDGTNEPVKVWIVPDRKTNPADEERLELPARTPAVIVKDEPVAAPKQQALRLTRVRLVGGPHAGVVVEVARYKIRPPR